MRYHETSLFLGQDIQDLSMDPDFADLLGYTQADIEHSFADYIPLACEQLHLTQDELFERLRVHYDGFCFDENASVKVYCPYAINKFFSLVKSPSQVPYFGSFWMESADARLALISYLREHTLEAAELEQICQQRFTLSYQEITEANCFGKVKFKQLLVHAGYFSILSIAGNELDSDDEPEPPEKRKFTCGITNKDVEDVFVPVLTQYLLGFDEQKLSELEVANAAARQNLLQGNIEQMCMQLNQGLCKVGDSILHDAKEGVYAFFLEQALRSKKLATARAKVNNLGHSGFVAETQDRIYVFELKHLRKATATQADQHSLLEEMEQQLLCREYRSSHMDKGKPITGIALVVYDQYRQICAWRTIAPAASGGIERTEGFIEALHIGTQQKVQQGEQVQSLQQLLQLLQSLQLLQVPQGVLLQSIAQAQQLLQLLQALQLLQGTQIVPVQQANQGALVQQTTQGAPVQQATQGAHAHQATQGAPVQHGTQGTSPVQQWPQEVPVQQVNQGAPVQQWPQMVPVQQEPQAVQAQQLTQGAQVQPKAESTVPPQDPQNNHQ